MVTVELNIPVICYGLRSDFSLKGFPGSTRLLELAHTIEEMKTICACGRKATCNCRKVNGRFVFEGGTGGHRPGERCPVRQHVPPVLFPGAPRFLCRPPMIVFPDFMPSARRAAFFCIFSSSVIYQPRPDSHVFCAIDISVHGRKFLSSSLLMYTTLQRQFSTPYKIIAIPAIVLSLHPSFLCKVLKYTSCTVF